MRLKMNNNSLSKRAVIREDECIGCTKCIQACPADAILGSATFMHTVISDECIGCKLCVAPCPVDCIDMVMMTDIVEDKSHRKQKASHFKKRYEVRQRRLHNEKSAESYIQKPAEPVDEIKAYVLAALERAKLKNKR